MGYRLPEKRNGFRPCHANFLDDTASKTMLAMDNGTISYIAIPCFYGERHDRMAHDHFGWPSPDSPDRSCQLPPGCEYAVDPIDLELEGYDSVVASMIDAPEGLSMTGTIDYGFVNLKISAMCPTLVDEDADVKFCVYVTGDANGYPYGESVELRDVVLKGILHIVAGPIE